MLEDPELEKLKRGDDEALRKVYMEYRRPFLNYIRKFELDQDTILDIYQDSIITLHENILHGKLTHLTCSLKTYLFGIGKFKVYAYFRKNKKTFLVEDSHDLEKSTEEFEVEIEKPTLTEKQQRLKNALKKMTGKCKEILELFYFRGLTIDEIRDYEGYENKNTVKSQKSRCLKTLKKMILEP